MRVILVEKLVEYFNHKLIIIIDEQAIVGVKLKKMAVRCTKHYDGDFDKKVVT